MKRGYLAAVDYRLWESDIHRNLPEVATEVVAAVRLNLATGEFA